MSQIISPTLGGRIRAARVRAGLSHDRLGELVGTSRRHLIRLEQDVHTPKPEMLARIAAATSSTVEDLKGSPDDDEEADPELMETALLVVHLLTRINARATA